MFTVKQILQDGTETIQDADRVTYCPTRMHVNLWDKKGMPAEGFNEFTQGTVYVMNESGKTVSVYYLSSDVTQFPA